MTAASLRRSLTGTRAAQLAYTGAVAARLAADRWTLALRAPRPATTGARILAYHSVGTPEWGVNDVTPRHFERHLQVAVDDGWRFATTAEVLAAPDERLLALTFDDGVRSVLVNAVPVLRHHAVPATAFVVSGWADGQHPRGHDHVLDWAELADLQDAGVALGSHSVSHPDFGRLDPSSALAELEGSRDRLQRRLGVDVEEFAIPFGQSRNWSEEAGAAARSVGYTTVYAQAVATRPAGTVARTFVTRIDSPRVFRAALAGCYDYWEEWF